MSDTVIRVEGLGKKYIIGHQSNGHRTLRDVLADSLSAPFRVLRRAGDVRRSPAGFSSSPDVTSRASSRREEFWALKDVSFDVSQGEVVGIIGRNGAGKSTLLKILSRITEPTIGRVRIRGRVASLLEVGTGFHPELTGRENVFLNGAILGMTREEIKRKFDEIVAFAEVEKFLDTPVKRYSSGMYVRLAFAVAAHLEPEILIVDEVLAVGDAQFQKKCLGRMKDVGKEGRTVLFVSHNMAAVSTLCSKVAWLSFGQLAALGEVRRVVGDYLTNGAKENLCWRPENPSAAAFRYHAIEVVPIGHGISGDSIAADSSFQILFDYSVSGILPSGRLAFLLTNQDGTVVLSSASTDQSETLNQSWKKGRNLARCTIPDHLLAPGRYYLTISEPTENGGDKIHENIINFSVSDLHSLVSRDGRSGIVSPILSWNEERVTESL